MTKQPDRPAFLLPRRPHWNPIDMSGAVDVSIIPTQITPGEYWFDYL